MSTLCPASLNSLLLTAFTAFTVLPNTFAQKFGYVDVGYVMKETPEYQTAQGEIDKLAKGWEQEIVEMYQRVDSLKLELKAEEVLITQQMRDERQGEIDEKLEEIRAHQKEIFGFEGLYFLKKEELILPIQDRIYESVERVAKSHRLQIIFDKSADLVMIYTDPIHDYTDFVMEDLGLGGSQNNSVKN